MRKKILAPLVFVLCSIPVFSKPNKIDSLSRVLRTQTDTFRLHTLIRLSQEYIPVNADSALRYARMFVREAQAAAVPKRIAESYLILGSVFHRFPGLDSDFFYKRKAAEYGTRIGYKKIAGKAYNDIGLYEKERGNFEEAQKLIIHAAEIAEELHDEKTLAVCYTNIALILHSRDEKDKAVPYYRKAMAIFKKKADSKNYSSVLANLASIYDDRQKYDSALTMYKEAYHILDSMGIMEEKARIMNNLGVLYRNKGERNEAEKWLNDALALKRQLKDIDGAAASLYDLAWLYRLEKQYARAENLLAESEQNAWKSHNIELRRDIYAEYAELYSSQGRYADAFKYLNRYTVLKDSVMNNQKLEALTEMQTKYESEKKERENKLLKQEAQVNQLLLEQEQQKLAQEHQKRNMLYAGIAALALLLALAFYAYYQNRRSNRLLTEKNEQINRHNRTLKELNARLIESEDELTLLNATKDRLFSVVSHDISNPVKAMANYNQAILSRISQLSREELADAVSRINQSIQPLQVLVDNLLHWSMVQKKGMQPRPEKFDLAAIADETVQLFAAYALQKNVPVQTDYAPGTAITADKNMVRLVVRNILGNALKFSPPGSPVWVGIRQEGDKVFLSISDKGRGLSPAKIRQLQAGEMVTSEAGTSNETGTGLGLMLVTEYLRMNGNSMRIESKEGEGTTFEISFASVGD